MIDKRDNANQHASGADGGRNESIDPAPRDHTSSSSSSPQFADAHTGKLDERLLVCAGCGSRFVHPADCEEDGRDHWYIELRCPDCGNRNRAWFDLDMLDALDRELDRAEAEIEADLACLTRANMFDYVSRFVAALDAGAIEPEDFMA